jgi:hypothetical protein
VYVVAIVRPEGNDRSASLRNVLRFGSPAERRQDRLKDRLISRLHLIALGELEFDDIAARQW